MNDIPAEIQQPCDLHPFERKRRGYWIRQHELAEPIFVNDGDSPPWHGAPQNPPPPQERHMTEALKPCPFCGEAAYTDRETATYIGRRTGHAFAIACSDCEASAPGADLWPEAVNNWNRRAPSVEQDDTWNAAIDAAEHVVKERAAELSERNRRPVYTAAHRIRSLLRIRPEDQITNLSDD